jgi:ABC-2 type transport system ATP-binding protein
VNAIEVRALRVSYGPVEAVRGLDLDVEEGEVFALLGPNGAGKTSTVEVLEGFRRASGGSVRVLGADPRSAGMAFRRQVGVVLQEAAVEPYLTVREVLTRNAAYYPDPMPVEEVIERVGLGEKADARVKKLSGGQQRRLDVALGIVGRPRLLFLDEPTTGFDPGARRGAWELVKSLRDVGTTIVLTTHYMDEAQALADRLAIVARGQVVASGTPAAIGGRDTAAARIRFALPAGVAAGDLPVPCEEAGERSAVTRTEDPARTLHLLTGWLLERGLPLDGLAVDRPTLEDVYLELTKDPT